MRIERVKNAKRNIITGMAYKMVSMFGPFIMRSVLLYTLGVQYLGLNSLFTAILHFLSLTELGVGSAMVYAMYKPIAEDDDATICALLNLYRKLYRIIGCVILVLGMILYPFIPHLVSGDVPADINLHALYVMYLLNTVLSYFLYGYKQSLLLAFQRNDIISTRALILRILMYGLQAVVLFVTGNYYLYVAMFIAYTVCTNLANSILVDRMFPQYKCKGIVPGELLKSIKTNVVSLIGGKLIAIMLNFSDNLMISIYLGLTMVARFDNYYYVINALVGFFVIVYEALTGGLGNSIQMDSVEKNHNDFKALSFVNFWLVSWCSICIMCIMQPFIILWVGEELMFSNALAILFALYFYVLQSEKMVLTYKDAAGIWWQDRFRPYVVIAINTIIDLLFIRQLGVYCVVISTIIALAVSVPWSAVTLYKHLFKRSAKPYLMQYLMQIVKTVIAGAATYYLCTLVGGNVWVQMLGRMVICVVVPNVILFALNLKNPDKKLVLVRMKSVLRKKR